MNIATKHLIVASCIILSMISCGCATNLRFNKISNETRKPSLITVHFSLQTEKGEPVPYLTANDFVIKEDGKEVSSFESKQTILPRNKQFELVTILLLDMSGSIVESGSIPSLQDAMKVFIETVSESQIVAIYAFDGRKDIEQLLPFTTDKKRMIKAVNELKNYKAKDPSTNLNGAVLSGLPLIDGKVRRAKSKGKISTGTLILFTDGTDQAGRVSDYEARATAQKSTNAIFSIGLGGEIDKEHLKSVGKNGSEFAEDTSDIVKAFASIADQIKRESNKYYAIAYCSPKRAGRHKFEISVREMNGSLGYEFSANGFMPDCDPQKALDAKEEKIPKPKVAKEKTDGKLHKDKEKGIEDNTINNTETANEVLPKKETEDELPEINEDDNEDPPSSE